MSLDYSKPETFSGDITLTEAIAAHSGTSWSPERRGAAHVADYGKELASIYTDLRKHVSTEAEISQLNAEFQRFREGFAKRYRAWLYSRSRVVSTMIAGPSNFPVRRMEKRNHVCDRRLSELLDFRKRAIAAITKTVNPGWRPIMSGDADAVERLTEEIAQAEALQERMKTANKTIRANLKKGKEEAVFALVALGFKEMPARKLIEPDCCGRIGFADYSLTNNNANIRRMKARLEVISANKAKPDAILERQFARIEDSPAANRLRLFFPSIPSKEIREDLKKNGFRWSPSIGAWQAYRNHNSATTALRVAGPAVAKSAPAETSEATSPEEAAA